MEESELIVRARAGDRDAFADLVLMHQARLRAAVARYVVCAEDVQDIVQESLIDAWRNLERYDGDGGFGRWAWGICRNRMRNYHRSRRTRRSIALDAVDEAVCARADADTDAGNSSVDEVRIAALRSCLGLLSSDNRGLLDLRYHLGLAVREVAKRCGRSEAATAMALSRLRAALVRCVERGADPEPR
jgi:RNA polymerase sigma-70 factor, ECF subfamily